MNRTVLILLLANEARGALNVAAILQHGARLDAFTVTLGALVIVGAAAWPIYRRVQVARCIARRLAWEV